MDGVTILQTLETTARPEWAIALSIICSCAGLLFAISAIVAFNTRDTSAGIVCLMIAFIVLFVMIGILFLVPKTTIIEYKVLVDDTVNMNEFFQTYKIMHQEGLIYVVQPIG